MRPDFFKLVNPADDFEVKAPRPCDARLPQVAAFIVLLSVERRMANIAQ
jgi:hypothetical protein